MFPPLLLAAVLGASPSIDNVAMSWSGDRLKVEIAASGQVRRARADIHGRWLRVAISGATLADNEQSWGDGGNATRARRTSSGVLVEAHIGNRLACSEPVAVETSENGVIASADCVLRESAKSPAASDEKSLQAALSLGPASEPASSAPPTSGSVKAPAPAGSQPSSLASAPPAAAAPEAGPRALAAERPDLVGSGLADRAPSTSTGWALPALLLAGLAGGAYAWARKRERAPHLVQVLETANLGPKRALVVAKVGTQTLLLGASESGITLLTNVADSPALEAAADRLAAGVTAPLSTENERAPTQASFLARLIGRRPAADEFEGLLAQNESVEDQELRRKLQAGLSGRVA